VSRLTPCSLIQTERSLTIKSMKSPLALACIFLKLVWQAVSLRSALAALLLAPLAALCADDSKPSGVRLNNFELPVVLANPGAEFQDDARPGAMIIGMDRTPKGRIWGCWKCRASGWISIGSSSISASRILMAPRS
jgi:hypothetical protein